MKTISARLAVEKALRDAAQPLDAEAVSKLAGLDIQKARNQLSLAISTNRARNIGTCRRGLYLWGGVQLPEAANSVSRMAGEYRGEKPAPMRPGAMDAYSAPSIQNGERVPRVRPMLISAIPNGAR